MKAKFLAAALLLAASPAQADLIAIDITGTVRAGSFVGSSFTSHWTVETHCTSCDYQSGNTGYGGNPSPILSASLTIGSTAVNYATPFGTYGVIYAYDDQVINWNTGQLYSAFYINITVEPGQIAMNQFFDIYSVDLPGNLNTPFSYALTTGDTSNGSFSFAGYSGYLRPEHVTLTNLSPTPGPTVGAGLPGLLMLFALWRRRRCARSC